VEQEIIAVAMVLLGLSAAWAAYSRWQENQYNGKSDAAYKAELPGRQGRRGLRGAEPLLRFYDQETPLWNSSPASCRTDGALSFLIRRAEGSHFNCYVIRSPR
jgi:hypothetical protein